MESGVDPQLPESNLANAAAILQLFPKIMHFKHILVSISAQIHNINFLLSFIPSTYSTTAQVIATFVQNCCSC